MIVFHIGNDSIYVRYLTQAKLTPTLQPDCFWVNPFGVAFSLINKSDLILVNHHGQVIDGGEVRLLNTAAYMIHAAVHTARPDVICAAHSYVVVFFSFPPPSLSPPR
jgi:ribulose-5-phosphate 4-epimerase/fuculose-1-phosphate aldolase